MYNVYELKPDDIRVYSYEASKAYMVIEGAVIPELLQGDVIVVDPDGDVAILHMNKLGHVGLSWLKYDGEIVTDKDGYAAILQSFFLQDDISLSALANHLGYKGTIESGPDMVLEYEGILLKYFSDYISDASYQELFIACMKEHDGLHVSNMEVVRCEWPHRGWSNK